MGEEFQGGICSASNWCNTSIFNDQSTNWTQSFSHAEMYNQIETSLGDEKNEANDGLLPVLFESIDSLNNYIMNDSVQPSTLNSNHKFSKDTMKRSREINNKEAELSESKRARISLPSYLPTFKVRKEKLGDRITALQQLVSPFGKTDTASVLEEAIDHIKFLHCQVGALSRTFLMNSYGVQQKRMESSSGTGVRRELRSHGLCLVPVSVTFELGSGEPDMGFWAPALFG